MNAIRRLLSTDAQDPLFRIVIERDGDLVTLSDEIIDAPDVDAMCLSVRSAIDLSVALGEPQWLLTAMTDAPVDEFSPFRATLPSADPSDPRGRFRVERDNGWSTVDVVHEDVTSRAATAEIHRTRAVVLLDQDQAAWARETLREMMTGCKEQS